MNPFISKKEQSKLSRDIYTLPDWITKALDNNDVTEKYTARPAYQKNDYIGWITRAKTEKTQKKRLEQMIEELKRGDTYMKMAYSPK